MKRPRPVCPEWCSPYRCTAGLRVPGAEHRSDPITWTTRYGFLIVTLVQTAGGRTSMELRADVRLSTDPRSEAQRLAVGVDLAVRDVLEQALARAPGPAISRI